MSRGRIFSPSFALLALASSFALSGCATTATTPVTGLRTAADLRQSPSLREAAIDVPELVTKGDQERALAQKAQERGDHQTAEIHAERAIAAYEHARSLSRLTRASRQKDTAATALGDTDAEIRQLTALRAQFDEEAKDLESRIRNQRGEKPIASGPADSDRELARATAARGLAAEARLLCNAAKLLLPTVEGLSDAERDANDVESKLASRQSKGPAIDAAARARAQCLNALTRARRTNESDTAGSADTLLAELSAAGNWEPQRDSRGVIVAFRDAFRGNALTPEAEAKLKELVNVARAHPTFAIQIVIHEATPPTSAALVASGERAKAAGQTFVAGGIPSAKVQTQAIGAELPVIDPRDTKNRQRNARLEIAFVAPSN